MKNQGKGMRIGRILIILAILFVLYLIGRAIFGSSGTTPLNLQTADEPNANTNFNTNVSTDANLNGNTNGNVNAATNANSNANANTSTNTTGFSTADCTKTFSRGSADQKRITLTFNVGTSKEGQIQKVLDSLKNTSTAAAFFARGDVAENNPDLINKIDQAGFPIYNFSYNHPYFTDLPPSGIAEQLEKAESAISQRTGKTTKPFFRPPYGSIDDDVFAAVKEAGYCSVTWTIDALDWSSDSTDESSKERVLTNATNGAIILMQASNAITADIVSSLITELQAKGFTLVDLTTLLKE